VLYFYRRKAKIANGSFIHIIGIIPIFIMLTALIFTQSRGAWLGFLVALLVILLLARTRHRIKLFSVLALTIIGFNFLAAFYLPEYRNLLGLITVRFLGDTFLQDPRFTYLPFTLDIFKQYPILGVGIGGYGLQLASYFNYPLLGSAHGIFWSVLAETGIIGFLAFSWLIFVYYKTLIHALKKAKGTHWYPYIIGYLACFTGMMVQYLSFGDRLNMYVWVFMGVSMATVKLIKKEQKQKT
jgi:O-antigen ligase